MRLKGSIKKSFPEAEISCYPANDFTRKIKVIKIEDGNKKVIWDKKKADTENNHAAIIGLIKSLN